MPATRESLANFVSYCQRNIRGDEKSESQLFLIEFFRAFGYHDIKEIGVEFEVRLKNSSATGKIGFADLVWRSQRGVHDRIIAPGVVIEMKSKGVDLSQPQHYRQLERYWMRIVPDRPRYAILCNFDEFWIFDFINQVDEPVDCIALTDIPSRLTAFNFMEKGGQEPNFRNNQVSVTEKAARRMGQFYLDLYNRGKRERFKNFTEEQLQCFTLQCVLAMFAEDRGLLPSGLFVSLVNDCLQGKGNSYDLLGGLFVEMNRINITPDGRYKGVNYFNGGLFNKIHPISLDKSNLKVLDTCAVMDWKDMRPSIFGSIFESAIDSDVRHAHGIHYTSETDIRKIVRPTISDYWEDRIEMAQSIEELNNIYSSLRSYRVLDPACGSGNFLYIAYQELKQVEQILINKIIQQKETYSSQVEGCVTPLQFFGIDTNSFAVQLARVTMMIARKIAIDKHRLKEDALPLNTLDNNIVCKDALFNEWIKADAIIGNPPFLGGKKLRKELGDVYTQQLYDQFSDVSGQPDFCVFWFRKAHDNLDINGRAGLVGTNSITQNVGRAASLNYIVENGGFIYDAISTQPWSGDAIVHVSIVNWSKQASKQLFLDGKQVSQISSSLSSSTPVTSAKKILANINYSFEGCKLIGKGFIVSEKDALLWIQEDPKNLDVLKPMVDGLSLINPFLEKQWVIDFYGISFEEALEYQKPLERVRNTVKLERDRKNNQKIKEEWWLFERSRPNMRKALQGLQFYFALPKVAKWTIFSVVDISVLPCEANMVIASDDFYVLGIITSKVHQIWVKAQSSTLKGDIRYTNTTCFETFPFPQNINSKLIEEIRQLTKNLHEYRLQRMKQKGWNITKLYNTDFNESASQLCKLHKKIDSLVMKSYGFDDDDNILEKLLILNLDLNEKEKKGEKVIGPWANE